MGAIVYTETALIWFKLNFLKLKNLNTYQSMPVYFALTLMNNKMELLENKA